MTSVLIYNRFRWAVCQLDTLRQCRKARDIREALTQLPTTLDQTYERMLDSIDPKDQSEAFAILRWLTSSRRPLTLPELAEAAIIQPADQQFDPQARFFNVSEVLRVCGSLITYSAESHREHENPFEDAYQLQRSGSVYTASSRKYGSSGRFGLEHKGPVRFAHYSVQEFLLSGRAERFGITIDAAEKHLAGSCLLYLQHMKQVSDWQSEQYPLLDYAAEFWFSHWEEIEQPEQLVTDLTSQLFDDEFTLHAPKWLQRYEPCTRMGYAYVADGHQSTNFTYPGALYYAVHHNLRHIVQGMLEAGALVNELHGVEIICTKSFDHRLLHESIGIEHLAVCRTCLHLAVLNRNLPMVELLLEFGADPNIQAAATSLSFLDDWVDGGEEHEDCLQTRNASTVLGDAVASSQSDMVKLLLDHGATPDVNPVGCPSLIHATSNGDYEIALYLLQKGASAEVNGLWTSVLLRHLTSAKVLALTHLLIRFGANLNSVEDECTGLQAASKAGNQVVVQVMLEAGADINIVGQDTAVGTPIVEAIRRRDTEMMTLLIRRGADIDGAPRPGMLVPLTVAVTQGDPAPIALLIRSGADITRAIYPKARMALAIATVQNDHALPEMLVRHKREANVEAWTMFLESSSSQNWDKDLDTAKLLLDSGAHINACPVWFEVSALDMSFALVAAATWGRAHSCQMLLDSGANVGPHTSITVAALKGRDDVVRVLIQAGADVNAEGCIQQAAHAKHWDTVRTLLHAGANVHAPAAQQTHIPGLLYSAASAGKLDIVRLLLDAGCSAACTYEGKTPLRIALDNGHLQVAELLRGRDSRYTKSVDASRP